MHTLVLYMKIQWTNLPVSHILTTPGLKGLLELRTA